MLSNVQLNSLHGALEDRFLTCPAFLEAAEPSQVPT